MKHEKAFSMGGFYTFVLEANLMLHCNVAAAGQRVFADWLKERPSSKPIRLLDLACGGAPISISNMMAAFPQHSFLYIGIDINPDQVNAARAFPFSENVIETQLIEGDAWVLPQEEFEEPFDIIFSGMNLHHGTPEEIFCLLEQIKKVFTHDGLFLNHDFYRPGGYGYLRRPTHNPKDQNESFAMITNDILAKNPTPKFDVVEAAAQEPDWRLKFVDKYIETLRNLDADERGIQQIMDHVLTRDYPIALEEMHTIANHAGFVLEQVPLDSASEPLGDYFLMVKATPK